MVRAVKIEKVPPAYCAPVIGAAPLPQPKSDEEKQRARDNKIKRAMRKANRRGMLKRASTIGGKKKRA